MGSLRILGQSFDILPSLGIILAVFAIAVLASLATNAESSWYALLRKPDWQAPRSLFAPAWTIIYLMLIASAVFAWHSTSGNQRVGIMILYALNGALNLAWSFIFFRSRNPTVAAVDITGLLISILWIIVRVVPFSPAAALLLIPYLLWVAYATLLNWTIARMN
jgi:translocator protein